jgi:glucan phosphoethanolaminetransferase (alkaline phosphatase superfamily)
MNKYTKEIGLINKKTVPWLLFLSFIVLLPNIFLACYGNDISGLSLFKAIVYLIISCFLFFAPSLFLKLRVFFLFQGVFVLFAPLEIAHIYLNRMPVTSAFLLSIIDTNWNESTEVLSSLKIPIFCLLVFWGFYFYITIKKIDNIFLIKSLKIRIRFLVAFLIVLFVGYSYYLFDGYHAKTGKMEVFRFTNKHFLMQAYKIYPYDLIFNMCRVYNTKSEMKKGEEKIKNFHFQAYEKKPVSEREVFIFVIGETGRYDSYSINGYPRETSPMLAKTENLISYSDMLSEANITSSSLPIILTRASARDYDRAFIEKSFVDAFKEAGFKTYWIANQSASNGFIRRISKDTDDEFFMTTNFDSDDNYDEKLWKFLSEVLKKEDKKVLIVLHTLGSHFRYNFRYPPSYEIFKPSLKGSFDYNMISAKNKEMFINTYDNSIAYTDFFLATTIQKLDSLNAVSAMIYVADHGENLFDTPENIVMHGGSKFTKYDLHVPFFVWTSNKYNQLFPEKTENLIRNKDIRLTSDCIFYSILDMADITFPEQNLSKSIASEQLKPDSIRYMINTNMEVKKSF